MNNNKTYESFGLSLLAAMAAATAILGLLLLFFLAVSRIDANEKISSINTYNHFWLMVGGDQSAEKTELGTFAQDVRSYQGLPFSKDVQPKLTLIPYCKSDLYPGLDEYMGDSLFSDQKGGLFQPAFLQDINNFKRGGLKTVIRDEIRYPITIEPDTVQKGNKAIVAYNRMWYMVAGKQQCDATPEGRLASDLRDYLQINGVGHASTFTMRTYCLPSTYTHVEDKLGIPIFHSNDNGRTGLVRADFLALADQCKSQWSKSVIKPLPAHLNYYTISLFGWHVHLLSIKTFFILWTLVRLSTFLYLGGSSLEWSFITNERGWKLLTAFLVPSFFLGRAIRHLPAATKRVIRNGIHTYHTEKHHPYYKERMIAKAALKKLSRLPEQDEEVAKQRARADAILKEAPPFKSELPSNDKLISKLVSSTIEVQLQQAQASIDAKKEVSGDIK